MNALTDLAVFAQGYNPGITPNFNAPWMPSLQNIGGMILATAIVALAIVLVIGLVVWGAGKLGGSGGAQDKGLSVLLWGSFACVVLGSIGGLVSWFTGVPLFS